MSEIIELKDYINIVQQYQDALALFDIETGIDKNMMYMVYRISEMIDGVPSNVCSYGNTIKEAVEDLFEMGMK